MICLIPARSGSRALPGKNKKLLGGKPLLVWSIESAIGCGLEPVVSSESAEYLALAKRRGARALLRPASLAQDDTPMIEVVKHAAQKFRTTAMVLFQPTSPFRRREDVESAIRLFHEKDFDSVIAAVPIPEEWHPDTALQLVDGEIRMVSGASVKDRIRHRQDHRPAWVPSGTYIFKMENIASGSLYGNRVGIHPVEQTVNINDASDFSRAQEIAKTWRPE